MIEGIARLVGRQIEVVQARLGAPTVDHDPSAVQDHADLARHVRLGVLDEGVHGALER